MRILTVRQPWAWAIIHGKKTIENRSTNVAGDYRGPVAIHSAKAYELEDFADPRIIIMIVAARLTHGVGHPSTLKESLQGMILGTVNLVDVHEGIGCECSIWADPTASYHLVFADPEPLDHQIPHRGGLGLRRIDPMILGDGGH